MDYAFGIVSKIVILIPKVIYIFSYGIFQEFCVWQLGL